MEKSFNRSKGFTLVEMLIVVAIIIVLASAALISSFAMRDQIQFRGGYNSLKGIIGEARNFALSGQSFPDTSDYDKDGITGEGDLILPNGYIVNLFEDGGQIKAALYADLFDSEVGRLDEDNDQFIKMVELPIDILLTIDSLSKSGSSSSDLGSVKFIYKTPDAAFSVIDAVPFSSLQFKIEQKDDNSDEIKRTKYVFLHYLYGIPELLDESYF